MVHGVYGKIHADPLYHSSQVCPDISTMIDRREGVGDYFPLYGTFWGLFSTMLNPARGVC
jgi:hypothetical protein